MAGNPGHPRVRGAPAAHASAERERDPRGHSFRPAAPGASRGVLALTSLGSLRYQWKGIPGSSHEILRKRLLALPPGLALLDLGAGPGHLGAAVRGHFAHLSGLESDPEAASAGGAKLYDRWITAALTPEFSPGRLFDVIVCADVLEHLANPERILATIRGWLAPEGQLLVSLPNVANLTVRLSLLAGRFRYAERGILDRTHLRFYTRASARNLLEASGFRIDRATPTAMPVELAAPWLGRRPLRPAARGLAFAAARIWPTLFGYQFVFEARAA